MIAITLIIPVYNLEKYLSRCLNSCLRQNLDENEYEIIAVNDGSCDGSLNLLKEYTKKYHNILLIDKSNGGLSSARNAGLDKARGELVWFIDGDDWIVDNCLKTVCDSFKDRDIDMMAFNTYYATDDSCREQDKKRNICDGEVLDGVQLYNRGFIYPFTGVPFYIYRTSFLKKNKLRFAEGLYFEDWLFTPVSYVHCDKCLYCDKSLYYYYMRNGSITQSQSTVKKAEDVIKVAERLYASIAIIKRNRYAIIYKSVACLIKSFYVQWYYLNNSERRYLRKRFLAKDFWISSIWYSKRLKYSLVFIALLMNLRIMRLARYNH